MCKVALRLEEKGEGFCSKVDFTASEGCCDVLCDFSCISKNPPFGLPPTNQPRPTWPEPEAKDDDATQDRHGGTQMVQAPMHRIPST